MKTVLGSLGGLLVLLVVGILSLPTLLHSAGLHPVFAGPEPHLPGKRALIVTTSHSVLARPGETEGAATGVFGSEFTHPYYSFLDAGMEVDISSIRGGEIPIDPMSFRFFVISPEDKRYLEDSVAQAKVAHSIPIADVDISQYDIVFLAGGWGAAYDLAQSADLSTKVSEAFYGEREPVIGGVCHGVLGLINAKDLDGGLLIAGRRMTGVTDKQIEELDISFTPLHPETELRAAGVRFESSSAFRDFLATHVAIDDDERFVTGQNQNSGLETAHAMMQIVSRRTREAR